MNRTFLLNFFAIASLLAGTACKQDDSPVAVVQQPVQPTSAAPAQTAAAAIPSVPAAERGNPQPKLNTMKLWVGTNEVTAELAMTHPQISTGMMWRTNMAEMEGMLFVFRAPHQVAFYMKNTLLPLSCAYMDAEGTILEIYDMKPLDPTPIPSRSDQVQYVLEMNQGWFERHGIKPGIAVSTERGNFSQTFRFR